MSTNAFCLSPRCFSVVMFCGNCYLPSSIVNVNGFPFFPISHRFTAVGRRLVVLCRMLMFMFCGCFYFGLTDVFCLLPLPCCWPSFRRLVSLLHFDCHLPMNCVIYKFIYTIVFILVLGLFPNLFITQYFILVFGLLPNLFTLLYFILAFGLFPNLFTLLYFVF